MKFVFSGGVSEWKNPQVSQPSGSTWVFRLNCQQESWTPTGSGETDQGELRS